MIGRIWRRVSSAVDSRDLTLVFALVLIGVGLDQVSHAAALAVPGGLLFLVVVWPYLGRGGS